MKIGEIYYIEDIYSNGYYKIISIGNNAIIGQDIKTNNQEGFVDDNRLDFKYRKLTNEEKLSLL